MNAPPPTELPAHGSLPLPRRPWPLGRRGVVLLLLGAACLWAQQVLGLSLGELVPNEGGRALAGKFFGAALQPALDYEDPVPGAPPFLLRLGGALWRTLQFAGAGLALALVLGLPLGFLASSAWWAGDPARQGGVLGRARWLAPALQSAVRVVIAAMRSVHELLWAVLFLTAVGVSSSAAVVAIALPYAGTLAKVFSEMLDEASPRGSEALRAAGAGPVATFLFARLPAAAPDMLAYSFYRFECAVRSAAVLGFFGYETLGYHLRRSFEHLHYRETWTYLYAFFALVLVFEGWSIALRRRVTS